MSNPFAKYKKEMKRVRDHFRKINGVYWDDFPKIENVKVDKEDGTLSSDIYIKPPIPLKHVVLNSLIGNNMAPIYGSIDMGEPTRKNVSENFNDEEIDTIKMLKAQAMTHRGKILAKIPDETIVLAGGAFVSWYHGEKVNDIDVFIINDTDNKTLKFFQELADPNTKYNLQTASIRLKSMGDNILNYKNTKRMHINGVFNDEGSFLISRGINIQYIHTNITEREKLSTTFDFEHCKMNLHKNILYTSPLTLECIKNKLLYCSTEKPRGSRVEKFMSQGFKWHPNSPIKDWK